MACAASRGPKHVVKRGKTPILAREETFARIGAAIAMKVEYYYPQGKRWWLRLHEKGGKRHEVPYHHTLEEYLDAYVTAADLWDQKKGPLFRTMTSGAVGRPLSLEPLAQSNAWRMIRRRSRAAGIETTIGCHTFRATGIDCVSGERWHAGARAADRGARVAANDQALRPDLRPNFTR